MNCKYVQKYYGVIAEIGRRITYNDRPGIIAEDRGHYIGVNFDDEKPGSISNIHPTDPGLNYYGMGTVRKLTRSQQRYQDYLHSELDITFGDWLKYPKDI